MTTQKLASLTNDLKIADAALQEWKGKDEPLSATMVMQYELLKQELLKDLLVELVQSGVNFNSAGDFIQRLTNYLKSTEQQEKLPKFISSKLAEVEKLLVA
ncbi:MAG: hypothetical protein HY842_13075 [Bacteroidetes bacterium]|nr:hypothetical protein [Bacteroidota bacterium]